MIAPISPWLPALMVFHVGQDELPMSAVRSVVGETLLVGVSTHTLQQARSAVLDGADYIGCGPTFASQTKKFCDFAGTEFLRAVANEITLPAFAIGGINAENLHKVIDAGFTRVAVSGAIRQGEDPAAEISAMMQQLA